MLLIGPERLPEYAARLREFVRQAKTFADGAKNQLREQMGPEFDDIDWKSYDPRQYDPRRIVREALADLDGEDATSSPGSSRPSGSPAPQRPKSVSYDPERPTPFDTDAT